MNSEDLCQHVTAFADPILRPLLLEVVAMFIAPSFDTGRARIALVNLFEGLPIAIANSSSAVLATSLYSMNRRRCRLDIKGFFLTQMPCTMQFRHRLLRRTSGAHRNSSWLRLAPCDA